MPSPHRLSTKLSDSISFNFIVTLRKYYCYPCLIDVNTEDKKGKV